MTRESLTAFTARSMSASAMTMAGALPPSSRFTFVMFGAAAAITAAPVATLPVKLTIPMRGEEASALPVVGPRPCTTLMTPGGRPASCSSSQNFTALCGVSSLGLMTMELPVTSAGAAFRAIRKKGKFQGRIPPMTPMGWRNSRIVSPGRSLGMISPSIRRAHSAM
jgi:hypothetical protein